MEMKDAVQKAASRYFLWYATIVTYNSKYAMHYLATIHRKCDLGNKEITFK